MKTMVCAILVFLSISLNAKERTVDITTFSQQQLSKKILPGVTIQHHKNGVITNALGHTHLLITRERTYLSISKPGYKALTIELHSSDNDTSIIIMMEPEEIYTKQLTVIADRNNIYGTATQNVSILSAKEIDEHRGQTLGETLKNAAGLTTLQTGPSISKPVLRGLHSQRLLISNAGISQEGQQWGAEHAPEIDPLSVGTVHILKGAAGVEYGPGAMGGMIRIDPSPLPDTNCLQGSASIQGFSNNLQGVFSPSIQGAYVFDSSTFACRAQSTAKKAGDASSAEYGIGNTGFTEINGSFLSSYYHKSGFSLQMYTSLFTTEIGIFKGSHISNASDLQRAISTGKPLIDYPFSYAIDVPKQEIQHRLYTITSVIPLPSLGFIEAIYGWQYNIRKEYDAHNARVPNDSTALLSSLLKDPAMRLDLLTYSGDIKLRINELADDFTSTVGISTQIQENHTIGKVLLIPDYSLKSFGAYFITNYIKHNFIANAGLRFDSKALSIGGINLPSRKLKDTSLVFNGISGAAGLLWLPDSTLQCAFNIGTAWRAPQVNELYSNDIHHGTAQFEIGDPRLKTERSLSIDLTTTYHIADFHFEIGAYSMWFDNYILLAPIVDKPTVTVRGVFPTFRYVQSAARIRGIESTIEIHPSNWLKTTLAAHIVRGDNLENSQPLFQIPADRFICTIHAHTESLFDIISDNFCEFVINGVRHQDRFQQQYDYAPPPPGYILYDCNLGGTFIHGFLQGISISFSVQNILNTPYRDYLSRYRYFSLDQGRNFVFRAQYSF